MFDAGRRTVVLRNSKFTGSFRAAWPLRIQQKSIVFPNPWHISRRKCPLTGIELKIPVPVSSQGS